ncbi:MAG: hypothetical protein ACRDTP_12570 [Mycobacteriales bacterium]
MPRGPAFLAIGLSGLALVLTGCHMPGGSVQREVLVEFTTPDSAAAKPVVIARCGHLPGVSVQTTASADPNVHFDVGHASDRQIGAVVDCLSHLQATKPGLHIRDYLLNDGGG